MNRVTLLVKVTRNTIQAKRRKTNYYDLIKTSLHNSTYYCCNTQTHKVLCIKRQGKTEVKMNTKGGNNYRIANINVG